MGICASTEAAVSHTNCIDRRIKATQSREFKSTQQRSLTDASRTLPHPSYTTSTTAAMLPAFAFMIEDTDRVLRSDIGKSTTHREDAGEEKVDLMHKQETQDGNHYTIPITEQNEDLSADIQGDQWSDLESLQCTGSEYDTSHHEDEDDSMYSGFALDDFKCESQARFTAVYDAADILAR